MNNTPTPETDAFITQNTTNEGPTGVKWRSHAERLERERDEARKKLDEEMKWHHRTHQELVQAQCKLLDMEYDKLKS
jgi:hypothetical protein